VNKLVTQDQLQLFAEPVTDSQAPTYRDIVAHPVDLETMGQGAGAGMYKSFQMLRHDTELMCHNALLFNSSGDKYFKEARRFFREATLLFELHAPRTLPSTWGLKARQQPRRMMMMMMMVEN